VSVATTRPASLITTSEGSRAQAFAGVDALRLLFGSAVLWFVPASRKAIDPADRSRFWLLGFVWMAIPFLLFPIAEQWVASSVAGMINAGVPVCAAIVAAVLLRRLPGRRQSIGLAVGLIGVVVVTLPSLGAGRSSALGVVLLLLAVALYGLAVNLAVPLQQKYGGLAVTLRNQLAALVMVTPLAIWGLFHSTFAWSALAAVAVLGMAGTGLASFAMTTLVGRVGATRGSSVSYLFPIVAILLGVVFRHERLHPVAIAGSALTVVGAYIVSRAEGSGAAK
jgi:drug/metabolite transporter (DMT)-like permease